MKMKQMIFTEFYSAVNISKDTSTLLDYVHRLVIFTFLRCLVFASN